MSNLNLFFVGQITSGFAFELFKSAIAFHILNITNSPFKFSLAFMFNNLPKLIFLQLAGYVVDRFDKKKVFVAIDIVQAFYLFGVFLYIHFFGADITTLLAFTFINGFIKAFSYPSTKAIVPFITKSNLRMKASSFEISNDKIARTLAPTIAILFFARFGIKISILLTAFFYLFSASAKMFLTLEESKKESSFSIVSGFKSLFADRTIMLAWINSALSQFIFHPFLAQVMPNLLKQNSVGVKLNSFLSFIVSLLGRDHEDVYLSLTAIINLASTLGVVGSLLFFQFYGSRVNWERGIKISTLVLLPISILVALVIILFGMGNNNAVFLTYVLLPVNLLFFFVINTYNVFFTFYYQERVNKANIGRFVANLMTIYMGVKFVGSFLYGVMLERGFVLPVVVLVLAACLKVILYFMFQRSLQSQGAK